MKSMKYVLLAVAMSIYGNDMTAMKALEKKQQQIAAEQQPLVAGVPPAPAYKPKETVPSKHEKRGQRAQIKKALTPYTGYRKLVLILCDPSIEKMPNTTLAHLDTGFAEGVSMQTMVLNVAMALSQVAAPILVCNAYILENIFLMQYGAEAFMKKKNNEDSANFKKEYEAIKELHKKALNVTNTGSFFGEYKQIFHHEEEEYEEEENFDITEILDFPLDAIEKDFFLYSYKGPGTAYLLVPRAGSSSADIALAKHGFNQKVFMQEDIKKLKAKLKNSNGSFDYSPYVKGGKDYTYEQLKDFSKEALSVINNSLRDDEKNPWVIYLNGHGSAFSGETGVSYSSIAGLDLEHFNNGLLPILVDKNTHFSYILTCSIGGINRDRIRDALKKMPFDMVPKIAQDILGRKELKYPNNIITVLGGISDITTMTGSPALLPTKDYASFKQAWDRLDKTDPLVQNFLPFVQEMRFDMFFGHLINRLKAEEGQGTATRAALEPWKDILKHVTPYNVNKNQYLYNDIPQIRFPGHDAPFSVVDVDNRIQVLRYVDVKARELGGKLAGKGGEPIIIKNKDMVIVHPLSVNVPLEISGSYPSIISARSDVSDLFFTKITCQGDKNLQNTLHALFTFEAAEKIECDRYFLVEELQIKGGVYKDVLILNKAPYEESSQAGSAADGSEVGSEVGSEAGTESIGTGHEYFVETSVYYRTPDNKLMHYDYDHKTKVKEITISELDVTDDGYVQAAFTNTLEAVKLATQEERYR